MNRCGSLIKIICFFPFFLFFGSYEKVHAILKALPTNSQNEKRELDKATVKEQDGENVQKKKEKALTDSNTK